MPEPNDYTGLLEWRCIGPFRGGRVVAVAGDPSDPNVFYFGACAGGVWKTTDGGVYWRCVSDGFFATAAVGALAVAPSDPNVIYAGTGETTIRIDVSHGDGVYKSTDAGRTWRNVGLRDTRHIGKIRVHPHDPDTVWVAALGHAFGLNEERGVFKSTDGGATWRRVLFESEQAGAVDLSLDPHNPRILYAAVWEAYRSFWQISSGGPGSGLWKSEDGGESWEKISERPGLPTGTLGKIGVAVSLARSGRVWALIQHEQEGGLYRSDDDGATWEKVCADQNLISRAWYYMHLTADPQDPDTVYVNNLSFYKSTDGGKTFVAVATPHGDNHDLWIDPNNPLRMIQGNDGGATVSFNGGATWSTIYNQPTAQFYHIAADTREPYYVYGTQQDNSSIAVPSRAPGPAIRFSDCYVAGTGESGYIAVRPDDPNIVYVGAIGSSPGGGNSLQRYDHRTRQIRLITTWPEDYSGHGAEAMRYRFAWTYPILISRYDPNTLYIGGNVVFRSTNDGQRWEPISPDLSRADPETLKPTGGPINRDSVGAEVYATIFALAESPHERGVLWAGTDDGRMHITRDDGATWQEITPPGLPERTLFSCIEPSPFEPGAAYVAATRYKLDDYRPYLLKTADYGATWQRIDSGIPEHDFTRVIRADPARRGLLYAGTETGLYLSCDDGASWQRFQLNLPVAPIYDVLVKGTDLIAGTHGRSIWILDDLTPLHQIAEAPGDTTRLFRPRPTVRVMPAVDWTGSEPGINYLASTPGAIFIGKDKDGEPETTYLDVGQNPPNGVIVTFYLANVPKEPVTLTFRDAVGQIRSFSSAAPKEGEEEDKQRNPRLRVKAGYNRFVWDLRYPPLPKIPGKDLASELLALGPMVAPGRYMVTLAAGEQELSQPFEVIKAPSATASQADLEAQFELAQRIYRKAQEVVAAVRRMRDLRAQLDGWKERSAALPGGAAIGEAAAALTERVLGIEKELMVPDLRPGWGDNYNHGVRLLQKLVALMEVVELGDYRPTDAAYAVFDDLSARIDAQLTRLTQLLETDLPALNRQIAEAGVGAIMPR